MNKVLVPTDATVEQNAAINEAIRVLESVGLELIGTRPKRDR